MGDERKNTELLQIYINYYRSKMLEMMGRNQKAKTLPIEELDGKYGRAYAALQRDLLDCANMYLRLMVYEGFYCDGGWSADQYSRYGEVVSSPAFKSRIAPLISAGKVALMDGDFAEVQRVAMDLRAEVAVIVKRLGGYEDKGESAIIANKTSEGEGTSTC